MNVTNIYLSKHEDVKELAERIGTDIGSLELLTTENKKNVVVAINELKSIMSSVENNLGDYSTKQELTQAITNLINGADADSDTLKELADKITTLAQADNGLVSASSEQIFDSVQKEIARKNIDAVSTTDLNTVVDTLSNTHAKRSELEQAKTELSDSIEAKSSQLLGVITAEEATRKVEDEAIRGELALTNGKIQEAIDAIPEADLTSFVTKDELTQAIIDLFSGADIDSDTLKELADKITAIAQTDKGLVNVTVAQEFTVEQKTQARSNIDAVSTNELETQKEDLLEDIVATVKPLATKVDLEAKAEKAPEGDEYALVSSLASLVAPYATKVDLTRAITDLINGADADSDTLKELADKITALAQADNGLVSATSAQTFQESDKEIARKNIDAVSKATFEQAVATINSTKADQDELSQAKTDLTSSIKTKSEELQDAISAEEDARTAEGEAIRSEFAQANQALRQEVDVADEVIRGEVDKVNQQLQEAINAEQVARQEADTTINEQIDTKADKAPEGQEYALVSAIPDLTTYATKVELTQAITDLINGADVDSDTLKELADKITVLAQADNGLVSATEAQSFSESNKEIARGNIDAVSTTTFDEAVATINSTKATHEELEQAKTELADSIQSNAEELEQAKTELADSIQSNAEELEQAKTELADSIQSNADELLEAISTEEGARKAESESIRGELALTNGKIQEAIDAIPEVDLTPFATKAEVAEDIGDIANLPTNDKTSVVASISELFSGVKHSVSELGNTIDNDLAQKSELTPLATKVELTRAITDLINGADADSDTLKELADKITALAQADNGLVNALEPQDFNETQKQQARDNIDAAAKSDIPDVSGLATKAESDTKYHNKTVTYTRTEMDGRYPLKTASYTKAESDAKYPLKAASYTKAEGDDRYYTKTQSDANYHNKTVTYTSTEMDARYPLKDASYTKAESDAKYPLKAASYTKAESDGLYYNKKDADARYEYVGIAYTKAQSDANYHNKTVTYTSTEMDGRYALKAAAYTKAESDGKYPLKAASYTKAESDGLYYTKKDADARYEYVGIAYTKAQSDANYHNKTVTYTRTEMDGRYPLKSASYTKAESDGKYPLKAASYTKAEGDARYLYSKQAAYTLGTGTNANHVVISNYAASHADIAYIAWKNPSGMFTSYITSSKSTTVNTLSFYTQHTAPSASGLAASFKISKTALWHSTYGDLHTYFAKAADVHAKSVTYTRTEMDNRYPLKAASYTKAEGDARYYTKTQSDANYHKKTVTYTRTEMDARYPLKAASYTKAEGDARYAKVWSGTQAQYNAITTKDAKTIYMIT